MTKTFVRDTNVCFDSRRWGKMLCAEALPNGNRQLKKTLFVCSMLIATSEKENIWNFQSGCRGLFIWIASQHSGLHKCHSIIFFIKVTWVYTVLN